MTATELIDTFLAETSHQSLIDSGRVHDFLLDLRLALAAADILEELMRDE